MENPWNATSQSGKSITQKSGAVSRVLIQLCRTCEKQHRVTNTGNLWKISGYFLFRRLLFGKVSSETIQKISNKERESEVSTIYCFIFNFVHVSNLSKAIKNTLSINVSIQTFRTTVEFLLPYFNSSNNNYSAENEEIPTEESSLPSKAVAMKYLKAFEFSLLSAKKNLKYTF